MSTKGEINELIERFIEYMEENYGIDRALCLDRMHYKDWRDRLRFDSAYTNYVDYLIALKRLPAPYPGNHSRSIG
jgi:hypothetical protein